jgi:hypothetical protein
LQHLVEFRQESSDYGKFWKGLKSGKGAGSVRWGLWLSEVAVQRGLDCCSFVHLVDLLMSSKEICNPSIESCYAFVIRVIVSVMFIAAPVCWKLNLNFGVKLS